MWTPYILLLFAATAFAQKSCQPNSLEKVHLGHGHDINTGDLYQGGRVVHAGLKLPGGSGCLPDWEKDGPKTAPKSSSKGPAGPS
ncbi:hypothetical protein EJ06DRAFT_526383 [Trichodelitschia bisporula]|uniref:Uncharacterized protein n=1 Tax=Trichodelitschia bisporula TaxID=703511 RepID=A0A6G1I7N2_9PEZI|nr:hypothetical protein EJ06DRAFT_526383 [Trichodelitschia bisporula]